MDDRKTFRVGYLSFLAPIFGLGTAAALAIDTQKMAQREGGPWDPFPIAMILLIVYFSVFRLGRVGVRVDPRGVVVLNPFRRVRVAWDDIVSFSVDYWLGGKIVYVNRRDFSRVRAIGTSSPRVALFPNYRRTDEIAKELNDELRWWNERAELRGGEFPRPDRRNQG
jgi:PH (Pleckstrin Homology) domain-containing protein